MKNIIRVFADTEPMLLPHMYSEPDNLNFKDRKMTITYNEIQITIARQIAGLRNRNMAVTDKGIVSMPGLTPIAILVSQDVFDRIRCNVPPADSLVLFMKDKFMGLDLFISPGYRATDFIRVVGDFNG